ncbi:hypothetical protein HII31_00299 [Pseudocercospora fuligena]|uniref:Glycoside hydrolase family 78 protein n=1 Tax=Pseudocercospora fuligena TaxID=685502 RepID=A0A8H6VTU1_9PEZI|nr:hypothetical protein HII31_00299 [Pseudocercospora fuligena]
MKSFVAVLPLFLQPCLSDTASHILEEGPTDVFSPATRSLSPESIWGFTGQVGIEMEENTTILHMGAGSQAVLDFGVEVAGLIAFNYETNDTQPISLSFTESSSFIGNISDDTGKVYTQDWDRALNVTVNDVAGSYIMPSVNFRGGFRFLALNARTNISVSNITCDIGFAPNMPDLQAYTGYFSTSESYYRQLGRLWAAGAYTVQTNIAPQDTGRWLPQVRPGWAYNASLGIGEGPFLVDGAKRDRAIWPGDLGISGPAAALAFGDAGLLPWRNGLETLIHYQNTSSESYGEFPYAGPDTNSFRSGLQSETYHAWTLITIYDYVMYSGDEAWLNKQWKNVVDGVDFILDRLDPDTGLHNQTQLNDWGRQGAGGYNSALNALDYHALVSLAKLNNNTDQATTWLNAASKLKASYNDLLWDTTACLYFDNTTTTLHPQDGNALALAFNLTMDASQANELSSALPKNWNDIGPVTPELPDTISPFVSGIELLGHFRSGNPDRGLDLLQRLWGYLLTSPLMTASTFAEGISANGSLWYRSASGYAYDPKYTSLSHSWSAAPVQVLVHELVGLKIAKPGGREWVLEPQLGNVTDARAGFETPLGRFEACVSKEANGSVFMVEVVTPADTKGTVILPGDWTIEIDGQPHEHSEPISGGSRSMRLQNLR